MPVRDIQGEYKGGSVHIEGACRGRRSNVRGFSNFFFSLAALAFSVLAMALLVLGLKYPRSIIHIYISTTVSSNESYTYNLYIPP